MFENDYSKEELIVTFLAVLELVKMNKINAFQTNLFQILCSSRRGLVMEFEKVKGLIEGILFVSGEPVDLDELSKALGLSEADLLFCVKEMAKELYSIKQRNYDFNRWPKSKIDNKASNFQVY